MSRREKLNLDPASASLSAGTPGFWTHLPPGVGYAFLFAAFNALSFQIILGSPMVLYAKSLEASATVLGVIAGMMPLLVIAQIPAAAYIDRIGYKRFVYGGWGLRVVFIFLIALVPLVSPFLQPLSCLALLLTLLFAFNLSRGISSSAWLPWISSLVPPAVRGRYVSLDAACTQLGSLLTLILAAFLLGNHPTSGQFSLIFAFSAVTGAISLRFLKRIPDVSIPRPATTSQGSVPYAAMIRHPPFKKLLLTVAVWALAYGGMPAFTVSYLKAEAGFSEQAVLLLVSVTFLGGLGSLWLGRRLDQFGSKPVLSLCSMLWFVNVLGWMLLAGRVWIPSLWLVLLLQFSGGLLAALVGISYTRLAMALIPEMGRNHFFAIYSVVMNLVLGVAPILWGLLIDVTATVDVSSHGLHWNRFTLFFLVVAVAFLATFAVGRRLEEPRAASLEDLIRDILIKSPQRSWLKLWPRG